MTRQTCRWRMSRSGYEMILTLLPADGFEAQRDLAASTDFPPGE